MEHKSEQRCRAMKEWVELLGFPTKWTFPGADNWDEDPVPSKQYKVFVHFSTQALPTLCDLIENEYKELVNDPDYRQWANEIYNFVNDPVLSYPGPLSGIEPNDQRLRYIRWQFYERYGYRWASFIRLENHLNQFVVHCLPFILEDIPELMTGYAQYRALEAKQMIEHLMQTLEMGQKLTLLYDGPDGPGPYHPGPNPPAPRLPLGAARIRLGVLIQQEGINLGAAAGLLNPPNDDMLQLRLRRLRYELRDFQVQLRADRVFTSFVRTITRAETHPNELNRPKFTRRLYRLFNCCRGIRDRIARLAQSLSETVGQLAAFLFHPVNDLLRRRAIDEAIMSLEIVQALRWPFLRYGVLQFHHPATLGEGVYDHEWTDEGLHGHVMYGAQHLQKEVGQFFQEKHLHGWGENEPVPDAAAIVTHMRGQYQQLQTTATLLLNDIHYKHMRWNVEQLDTTPNLGYHELRDYFLLIRWKISQFRENSDRLMIIWWNFLACTQALAPVLSGGADTPEKLEALKIIVDMIHLFKQVMPPFFSLQENWPQLLAPAPNNAGEGEVEEDEEIDEGIDEENQ